MVPKPPTPAEASRGENQNVGIRMTQVGGHSCTPSAMSAADLDLPQSESLNPRQLRKVAAILNLRIGREIGCRGRLLRFPRQCLCRHDHRPL